MQEPERPSWKKEAGNHLRFSQVTTRCCQGSLHLPNLRAETGGTWRRRIAHLLQKSSALGVWSRLWHRRRNSPRLRHGILRKTGANAQNSLPMFPSPWPASRSTIHRLDTQRLFHKAADTRCQRLTARWRDAVQPLLCRPESDHVVMIRLSAVDDGTAMHAGGRRVTAETEASPSCNRNPTIMHTKPGWPRRTGLLVGWLALDDL